MNHFFKMIALLFCADLAMAQVCFYEHINFEGASFCVGGNQQINSLVGPWNDRISSISVPYNSSARVCEHENLYGQCLNFNQSVNDLRGYYFSDVITSLSVWQGGATPGNPPGGSYQSCFYEEPNFQGRRFCLSEGQNYPEFNNSSFGISSVRVHPNHRVILCQYPYQGGYCQVYYNSVSLLEYNLDNRVRSITVEGNYAQPPPPPPPPPPVQNLEVCFYTDVNFVGQRLCVRQGNEIRNLDKTGFNDRLMSVQIPWNTSVYVCEDAYFGSPCTTLSGSISNLADYGFGSRISSIRF